MKNSEVLPLDSENGILFPVCPNKTRLKIRGDTVFKNFTLYCPKCKQETLINIKQMYMSVIKEPDAKTQSFYIYRDR